MATKTRQAAAAKTEDAFNSVIDDNTDDENQDGTPKVTVKRCEDPIVWQQRRSLAERNQAPMWRKWSKWYEMMYAIKSRKGMAVWKSKLFIPIMAYKAWTMIAKLINLEPGFAVKFYDKVYSQEDRKHVDEANLKLQYDYDNPFLGESLRDKEFDTLADTVVCGTGFAMAPWVSGTRKIYTKFKKDDGTIDYSKANVEELDYGWNDLEPIDAFNVLAAPGGRSFEKKPWIIVKYRKTKSQLLESDLYDEAVIDKLKTLGKQNGVYDKLKQSKNKLIGTTKDSQESMDDTVDSFDVFECYEKTNEGVFLVTYAEAAFDQTLADKNPQKDNRSTDSDASGEEGNWYEIRNEKQPYWHGMYPLVPSYIRRRPHDSWGESIFEVTESMASGYNDIVNQMADNLAIVGNGGILMHETGTVIYDFYYAPGGEVRYSGTKPEFETPTSPDLQIFTTLLNLLETGITNATVSPYASGTPSDSADHTDGTAAGIEKMQEAAGDIMGFMKTNFMQFVKGVGIRWLSNNCQFFDEEMVIESSRYGKRTITRITSDSFNEKMVLTIDEASMTPPTQEQRVQNNTAWLNSMIQIQNQSFIQAGISPAAPGQQPIAPPNDPMTGEATIKPLYFDLSKLAQEISEEYGKPDLEEFLLQPGSAQNSDPNAPENDNTDLIAAIKEHVQSGELDPTEAQPIIDAIEGRYGNTIQAQAVAAGQQLTAVTGDQANATNGQTQPEPSNPAAGSAVAPGQAQVPA